MIERELVIDLTQYIETRLFEDQPHIKGRRIPVYVLAYTLRNDKESGISNLIADFDLSEAEVLAALLYYMQHKDLIDKQVKTTNDQYKHLYK